MVAYIWEEKSLRGGRTEKMFQRGSLGDVGGRWLLKVAIRL